MLTYSVTCGQQPPSILGGVDLKLVRERVLKEMERLGLNPTQLADRAEVNQSGLARWLRDSEGKITEVRARVLFQVIEQGLDKSLAEFFGEIEGGTRSASSQSTPPAPESVHGHLVSDSVGADPRLARLLGQTLIDAGSRIIAAETGSGTRRPSGSLSSARGKKPGRRGGGAGNR